MEFDNVFIEKVDYDNSLRISLQFFNPKVRVFVEIPFLADARQVADKLRDLATHVEAII